MSTRLTVATLNVRGLPLPGTRITERLTAIATEFEAGDIDLVCLQEVFAYHYLTHLRKGMPTFRHVAYRASLIGPAGGLVTFSRLRLADQTYARLPRSPHHSGLPARARFNALHSGMLTVRPADSHVRVINIHPTANTDGDWSEQNRFHEVQRRQFTALAQAVTADKSPALVCGDFNVPRSSPLHRELHHQSGLLDIFNGHCPPTFHPEYLAPGNNPHCIDFILATTTIGVEEAALLFTTKRTLPRGPGHVSDHTALLARLRIHPQT